MKNNTKVLELARKLNLLCSTPEMLCKSIRNRYKYNISIGWWNSGKYHYSVGKFKTFTYERDHSQEGSFDDYEDALQKALLITLKIIDNDSRTNA